MMSLCTKVNKPSSNGSLVSAIKPKNERKLSHYSNVIILHSINITQKVFRDPNVSVASATLT
jgi:hypothetical protein